MASAKRTVYNCDICEVGNLTEAEMRSHMLMQHTDLEVVCPFCDLSDITPQEMTLHVNSVHLDANSPPQNHASQMRKTPPFRDKTPSNVPRKSPNSNKGKGQGKNLQKTPATAHEKNAIDKMFSQQQERKNSKNDDCNSKNYNNMWTPDKQMKVLSDNDIKMDGSFDNRSENENKGDSLMDISNVSSCSLFSNISPSGARTDESLQRSGQLGSPDRIKERQDGGSQSDSPVKKKGLFHSIDAEHETVSVSGHSKPGTEGSPNNVLKDTNNLKPSSHGKSHNPDLNKGSDSTPQKSSTHSTANNTTEDIHISKSSRPPQPACGVSVSEGMETSFSCPLCSFCTGCGDVLNVHVNQAHFQDTPVKQPSQKSTAAFNQPNTSLSVAQRRLGETKLSNDGKNTQEPGTSKAILSGSSSESEPSGFTPVKREPSEDGKKQCPFCDLEVAEELSLQFHINGAHADEIRNEVEKDADLPECPVCGDVFGFGSEEEQLLQAHVDSHFHTTNQPRQAVTKPSTSDLQVAQELQRREDQARKYKQQKQQSVVDLTSPQGKENYKKTAVKNMEKAVSQGQMSITDFYTRREAMLQANKSGVDEGTSCTKDIIARVSQYYQLPSKFISCHWLCSPTDHYAGSYGDRGWGCGYRNLQMLLSCLAKIPRYQQVLFNGNLQIPSLPKLQQLIEDAWAQGFDPQGREQLKRVVGTSKWIGATEIYATLSFLRVKCQLIDFHCPTGKDGTHPRLFKWVRDYFSSDREFKPPLYLQHQGHSRTIVGLEEYRDGIQKLLIFDPGSQKGQMLKFTRGNVDNNVMKTIRRTMYGLKSKQYQIVAVVGVLSDAEKQYYKLVKSDRIP